MRIMVLLKRKDVDKIVKLIPAEERKEIVEYGSKDRKIPYLSA